MNLTVHTRFGIDLNISVCTELQIIYMSQYVLRDFNVAE